MGPVSDVGRSMMASLQQAMAQGMPVDQAVAYVKGMAQQGVAPLVDLYAMMNQFKRLQQPPAQPPPQGTVKDQIAQQAQQAEQQQMMQQGLGGLPAPVMDEAQYAGGGIVAFAEGDLVRSPLQFKNPMDYLNYATQRIPGFGMTEDEFIQKQMEEEETRRKKYGLGKYSELYKSTEEQIGKMEKEAAEESKRMKGLDRAEFFFNIAAEAAKPGGTLMQSIAQAGAGYSKQSKETNQRLRLLQKEAQQARMKLLEAEELRREGDISAANKLYDSGTKDYIDIGMKVYEEDQQNKRTAQNVAAMRAQVTPQGISAVEAELARKIAAGPGTPEERLGIIRGAGKRAPADLAFLKTELQSINSRITNAEKALPTTFEPNAKRNLESTIADLRAQKAQIQAEYPELLRFIPNTVDSAAGWKILGSRPAE